MEGAGGDGEGTLRLLEPHWNHGMIAASIAISLLGAFTSTQLYAVAQSILHLVALLTYYLGCAKPGYQLALMLFLFGPCLQA